MSQSFLNLIDVCDNFRLSQCEETLATFRLSASGPAVGLLRPRIVSALVEDNESKCAKGEKPSWDVIDAAKSGHSRTIVCFADWIDTPDKRSFVVKELVESWHHNGQFADVIGGRLWRNELYPIYAKPFGPRDDTNFAFSMERSACSLFGVMTYGVHLTIYRIVGASAVPKMEDVLVWVPTRAKTKQTYV